MSRDVPSGITYSHIFSWGKIVVHRREVLRVEVDKLRGNRGHRRPHVRIVG
jgi:hypothetical protein